MGIDFLDIIYRVEKELGIRFVREDFDFKPGWKYLVGEFYDLVESKVSKASKEILDSRAFHEKTCDDVKKALANGLGLCETGDWTKETTLQQLCEQIPEAERKKTWREFRRQPQIEIGEKIKRIIDKKCDGSLWLAWTGFIISLFLSAGPTSSLLKYEMWLGFLVFVLFGLFWLIFWTRYNRYRHYTCMPDMTLGEIADQVVLHQKKSLKADGLPYTREEIEAVVKAALCEALAVKPKDVTPEKDLIRDLGME